MTCHPVHYLLEFCLTDVNVRMRIMMETIRGATGVSLHAAGLRAALTPWLDWSAASEKH